MTPREYIALKQVWATQQASFHNAHLRGPNDLAFLPDDFVDPASREERKKQAMRDKMLLNAEQRRLGMMKPGDKDGVPEWALGAVN